MVMCVIIKRGFGGEVDRDGVACSEFRRKFSGIYAFLGERALNSKSQIGSVNGLRRFAAPGGKVGKGFSVNPGFVN